MADFKIIQHNFDNNLVDYLIKEHIEFLNWPIVYILTNEELKEAYIGETTDVVSRMKAHLNTRDKNKLSNFTFIYSSIFNKSATLDLESFLIKYIAGDGNFILQNGNLGLSKHKYYQQKDVYHNIFGNIWKKLQERNIVKKSVSEINNSDLFKYSPYKNLSEEQINGLKTILHCILDPNSKISVIQGGAGTGKTILAIFLFKLLKTDINELNKSELNIVDEEIFDLVKRIKKQKNDLDMRLVIPMQSFRKTISNVFKQIKGLKSEMVISPSKVAEKKYDLLIVDEGHRLRKYKNLASYFHVFKKTSQSLGFSETNCTELDWVEKQAKKSVIFYDNAQSIKPSDADRSVFDELMKKKGTRVEALRTQFRVKGGREYIEFIDQLFSNQKYINKYSKYKYDFKLYDDLGLMVKDIKLKEQEVGLSRLIAGYAWKWVSKNDKTKKDIKIGDIELQWNTTDVDWVNSKNAINEVGCIHTTQGYDLNYAGVIIGPELDYDFVNQNFIVFRERYEDKNGKNSIADIDELKQYILNIYQTLLKRAILGTYVFIYNKNLKKYFEDKIIK